LDAVHRQRHASRPQPLGIPGTTNMVCIASVGPDGDANM
jgi:hypothetical protein